MDTYNKKGINIKIDSSKIINFIKEKSKELDIDNIGIGSIERLNDFHNKYFKNSKYSIPEDFFPECRTIISACFSYNFPWNKYSNETLGYIAKYTTANYYKILSGKLKKLGKAVKEYLKYDLPDKNFFRIFVNSKINDKLAAYISGLGYYSKNSLIFIKNKGNRFVLGELLLSIKLPSFDIINDSCGECNECIKACPTGAISEYGVLNKDLCIHHFSSQLNWKKIIGNKNFIKLWGNRFFGCTACIDICSFNKNNIKIDKNDRLIGFVNTTFDLKNLLRFDKDMYKAFFKNNQISAGWIPTVTLARNMMASLYNLRRIDMIEEYIKKIDNYGWDESEKEYLKNFYFFLLNSKGN